MNGQDRVNAIEAALLACGAKFVIAGGYARDKFFGRVPKDKDYWVFPDIVPGQIGLLSPLTLTDVVDTLASEAMMKIPEWHRIPRFYTDAGAPYDPNNAAIDHVFCHPDADVIILNGLCRSPLDLVNRFDCTLNRFIIAPNGEPVYLNDDGSTVSYTQWMVNHSLIPIYRQQHRTNEKREAKMHAKCMDLTGRSLLPKPEQNDLPFPTGEQA